MTEIKVDFNSRGAHGRVRGSLRRAGNVRVGDSVVLLDAEEGMRFDAVVAAIDGQRVEYDVEWVPADQAASVGTSTWGFNPLLSLTVKVTPPSWRPVTAPSRVKTSGALV